MRRTRRAGRYPILDGTVGLLRRAGWRFAARAGMPSPANQRDVAHMDRDRCQSAAAISLRILDLGTNLSRRFLPPRHFDRRQTPFLSSRWAMQHAGIAREMTGRAAQTRIAEAAAVRAALDIEAMHARDAVVCSRPAGPVIRYMAIGTARMRKHCVDGRPRCKPIDRFSGLLRRGRAGRQRHDGGSCQEALYRSHAKAVCFDIGSERTRLPVSADTALARAATAGGVPGSPTPPILW